MPRYSILDLGSSPAAADRKRLRLTIGVKTALALLLPVGVVLALGFFILIRQQDRALALRREARLTAVSGIVEQELSSKLSEPVFDQQDLQRACRELASLKGIAHVQVFDLVGVALTDSDYERVGQPAQGAHARFVQTVLTTGQPARQDHPRIHASSRFLPVHVLSPAGTTRLGGVVEVLVNNDEDLQDLASQRAMMWTFAAILGGVIFASAILLLQIVVIRPLERLSLATEAVGRGGVGAPLPVGENDELGDLSVAFNAMTERLAKSQEDLLRAHAELEARVAARTQDLADANDALQEHMAERELAAQKLRLQAAAMESAANGIVITDRKGTIRWVNPAFTSLTGYSAEEALGKTPRLLKSGRQDQAFYGRLWKTISSGRPWCGEFINRRKDGSTYVEQQLITPVRDELGEITHFVGIKQDITERKLAEEALARSERDYRVLFERANDAIVIFEPRDEIILDANGKACELYGFSREELVGTSLKRLTKDIPRGEKLISDLLSAGKWENFETVHQARDGSYIAFLGSLSVIEYKGQQAILGINRDIRERKRIEEELLRAKESAESASQAKSQFLANMSHEIRTPMNAIIGMAYLALDTDLTAEQAEYLNTIRSSSESLLALINDILDFSKIEAGKLDLEAVGFDLRRELEEAMSTFAFQAHQKGLEMVLQVGRDVPQELVGDPGRLRQVVVNLVGNALKFTEQGSVTVTVRSASRTATDISLQLEVADTGIGIPQEKQDRIFESFTQVDGSSTRKYSGTGLGLAICSQLVGMMKGRIGVRSTPGAGSTFAFTVTLGLTSTISAGAEPEPASVGASSPVSSEVGENRFPGSRRLRALVVDDGAVNRLLAVRILEKSGLQVQTADDASKALALLQGQHFDIVFMDVQMPGMDGLQATRTIRDGEGPGKHLPIVAMTAHALRSDRERCLAAGMDGYISKPFRPEELLHAVEHFAPMEV